MKRYFGTAENLQAEASNSYPYLSTQNPSMIGRYRSHWASRGAVLGRFFIGAGYASNATRIHFGILDVISFARSSGLSAFLIVTIHSGVELSLPR